MIGMATLAAVLLAMVALSAYRSHLEARQDREIGALLPEFPAELLDANGAYRMTEAEWLPDRICDALKAWDRIIGRGADEVWIDAREAHKPPDEVGCLVRVLESRQGVVAVVKVVDTEEDPQGALALCGHLAHHVWPMLHGKAPDWACADPFARGIARALRAAVLEGVMRRSLMEDTPGRPLLYDLSQDARA